MGYESRRPLRREHWLLIGSNNGNTIRERSGSPAWFGRRFDLPEKGRTTPGSYTVPWAVAPRLVVLDEFHAVKKTGAIVYQALREMRRHIDPSRHFKLLGLSATPISTSLRSSLYSPLALILPASALDAFQNAADQVDSATRNDMIAGVLQLSDARGACSRLQPRPTC